MPVESFKFNKEIAFRKITVKESYTIKFVKACQEIVSGIFYCFKMANRNIPSHTNQSEILWITLH